VSKGIAVVGPVVPSPPVSVLGTMSGINPGYFRSTWHVAGLVCFWSLVGITPKHGGLPSDLPNKVPVITNHNHAIATAP